MSLLTPTEAHAFQKFLSSLDTTDFSAGWNMHLEVSHEHMPPAQGREALAQATKDLMSLDSEKWRYPLAHSPNPTRESPSALPVNRHPQSQSNSLSFLYSTRRERRVEEYDAVTQQPAPSRSRVHIPPLQRTVDPSSVSIRTRARTFAFENASSSSSSQSPIDRSSSSPSTHATTPTPISSAKRSPPPDPTVANKRRRQSSVASQQFGSDAGQTKGALLSPSQKKANHIQSEQKRRANIRRGYEALCDIVPALREAMLAEAMEEEETGANGKKAGRRRGRGKAGNEDGEKVDGRAGPKSEHVVLSKTIDYVTELLSEHDIYKQRLMVARSTLPLDHPLLKRHPDAPPPLWERKWTGGESKDGDEEEDDDES
ncbi:uncharacterized protein EDB91DRAFT_1246926 [Suillus paluster]|uniref:uncharacterized protein n=1 Tax=Suillus paluster TaxID=48578 RepID=UPI001B87002B|nr:uncharacterized protein EDB91DRAFT_1246926 [Suillus paluster]KAG1744044.1 hypothetical protein EDB91DRAFT_1246926 [Suillus paluster]